MSSDRETEDSFRMYKKEAMIAAKDLCYHPEVIERVQNAKTFGEIERIMRTQRLDESPRRTAPRKEYPTYFA